jgi:hypothetical protein
MKDCAGPVGDPAPRETGWITIHVLIAFAHRNVAHFFTLRNFSRP